MANPTNSDMGKLKRLARYIKQNPRAVLFYPFQNATNMIRTFTDTDWAGCIRTRKSTQGGMTMVGQHCIKSWSTTQAFISLSSAESEYYGVVKGASISLGMQSMYRDMGLSTDIELLTDASAAKGIASRRGLSSRTRHVAVHYLWLQERVISGQIKVSKVKGTSNPADLLTKHLTQDCMKRYMQTVNLIFLEGRADIAPQVSNVSPLRTHSWQSDLRLLTVRTLERTPDRGGV